MTLISMHNVSIAFGGPPVLECINMHISPRERVCILGRNGAGKSTLLHLLNGDAVPDTGARIIRQGVRTALLPQDVPKNLEGTVCEIVRTGKESHGEGQSGSDGGGEWQRNFEAAQIISRMELDPAARFATLSAGMKRRVLLAKALVYTPDILLLDEPTNHLDIDAIHWMETFLTRFGGTLFFVTHDRMFMRKLATRVVEIDRGTLIDWSCGYDAFLIRKQAALEKEQRQWERFDEKLAQEESWIRQGIKARRTRNEGRVRALEEMRGIRRARRQREGTARLVAQEAERTGKLVIEANNISFSYSGPPVISNFSTTIIRGDKVGIIGPNGSGKTTLLRLLLGNLAPETGTVRHGTRIEVGYFDQLRAQLDEHKSVQDNVAEGNDTVMFNGRPRHVISYLQDFLFTRERARSPVSHLSGGERNRLMLARLFTTPANVLVLDEPTNDLDIETLELLEELLLEFSGTLLLVSHDREFLNHVVTCTLVLDNNGTVTEYVGGYDDWRRECQPASPSAAARPRHRKIRPRRERQRTLTYKEQRELETLPHEIESLETAQQNLYELMADPTFYKQDSDTIIAVKVRLDALEEDIARAYQRWDFLERLQDTQT